MSQNYAIVLISSSLLALYAIYVCLSKAHNSVQRPIYGVMNTFSDSIFLFTWFCSKSYEEQNVAFLAFILDENK